jgi:hypothetical protein
LVKGPSGQCPAEEDVSATITGETLIFTNSALQNFAVGFNPRQDGSFHSIYADRGGATVNIA